MSYKRNNNLSSSKPSYSSNNSYKNKRNKYGLCTNCNRPNTYSDWCKPCNSDRFRKKFKNWTSGNELIDNFIQNAQLNAVNNREVLEWIPYDQFRDFKFVARGGFAKVYSAVWKDGFINKWNHEKNDWNRENRWRVALKIMHNSTGLTKEFFDEIRACVQCGGGFGLIRCYGISQDPDTGDFIIVLYYASRGNLRTYLEQHYGELDWKQKLGILKQIAEGLDKIHQAGFVHRDFHSGNILHGKNAEIADLGFTGPADKKSTFFSKKVYGVLPYVSPEVLRGKEYTSASDIYSFGIIMWEVSECMPPFSDRAHDCHLALGICRGLRPTFEDYVPKPFTKLVNRCWDANPKSRPKAHELFSTLHEWYWHLRDNVKNEITATFNTSDHDYSRLSSPATSRPVTETHPLAVYTSRLLNFPNLPEPINAPTYRRSISATSVTSITSTMSMTRSILTLTEKIRALNIESNEEEDTGYVTRQFDEDLVYESNCITGVIFNPEEEEKEKVT